jgi:hypothetical protein
LHYGEHQAHEFGANGLNSLARGESGGGIEVIDTTGGAVGLKQLIHCVSCGRFHDQENSRQDLQD